MIRIATPILVALSCLAIRPSAQDGLRGSELREALADKADEFWIYDDIEAGFERARKEKKPLLVSFRCVP